MKLLFCKDCNDVIRMSSKVRRCKCGKTIGLYIDDVNVIYTGRYAVPLGFANSTLKHAVRHQPTKSSTGVYFTAFVIPKECDTFRRVKLKDIPVQPI